MHGGNYDTAIDIVLSLCQSCERNFHYLIMVCAACVLHYLSHFSYVLFCCYVSVYGINSILYQRGIYPPETFTRVQKYGLTILVTIDDELKEYLANVLADVRGELLVYEYIWK